MCKIKTFIKLGLQLGRIRSRTTGYLLGIKVHLDSRPKINHCNLYNSPITYQ